MESQKLLGASNALLCRAPRVTVATYWNDSNATVTLFRGIQKRILAARKNRLPRIARCSASDRCAVLWCVAEHCRALCDVAERCRALQIVARCEKPSGLAANNRKLWRCNAQSRVLVCGIPACRGSIRSRIDIVAILDVGRGSAML